MQKKLLILSLLGLLAIPAVGFAVDIDCADPANINNNACKAPNIDFTLAVQKVLNLLFWVVLLASVVYAMIAGFKIVTAGGDPKAMEGAMAAIRNAVIGIIIAVLAKGLSAFANQIFR